MILDSTVSFQVQVQAYLIPVGHMGEETGLPSGDSGADHPEQ